MAETTELRSRPDGIHFHDDAVLAVRCPVCGAAPNELCSAPEGVEAMCAMYGVEHGYSIYAQASRQAASSASPAPGKLE